jgi:formylmethanofuran dehydrogenase subunit E
LQDIEVFSHLHVFFWLHKSTVYNLVVTTPWDIVPHGLFATRSPHRPNTIGHSVVELIEGKKTALKIQGVGAIDGLPVIDIKPYLKNWM